MNKLAGSKPKEKDSNNNSASKHSLTHKDSQNSSTLDPRSRLNSLRNGETSKVLQTHNIDVPILDKDQFDEF